MNTIRNITVFILLLTCVTSTFASVKFISSEIDTGDNRQGYWAADMNGDLLGDILIASWSESGGREFLIYTQEENGKFSNSPWRRIEIKKDIIAFALADLRPEPGSELLFFTASACYSLSCAIQGYADNLRKLFEWELIKSVPDKSDRSITCRWANSDRRTPVEYKVSIIVRSRRPMAVFRSGCAIIRSTSSSVRMALVKP